MSSELREPRPGDRVRINDIVTKDFDNNFEGAVGTVIEDGAGSSLRYRVEVDSRGESWFELAELTLIPLPAIINDGGDATNG